MARPASARRITDRLSCACVLAVWLAVAGGCGLFGGGRSAERANTGLVRTDAGGLALDPFDADARAEAVRRLADPMTRRRPSDPEPEAVGLFLDAASDADAVVRRAGTRALGLLGDSAVAGVVVDRLDDPSAAVRLEAARALQRVHAPEGVPGLIERIDPGAEPDATVRAQAAEALGQFRQRRVLEALIAALDDRDVAVNAAAASSLRTLTGQSYGVLSPAWRGWLESAGAPFAGAAVYTRPGYRRSATLIERLPFTANPPREAPRPPAGLPEAGTG